MFLRCRRGGGVKGPSKVEVLVLQIEEGEDGRPGIWGESLVGDIGDGGVVVVVVWRGVGREGRGQPFRPIVLVNSYLLMGCLGD